MVRIDVENMNFQGTLIDGYLPDIDTMKELARLHHSLDVDQEGIPGEYGFSCVVSGWTREEYFGSMASAMRGRFDHDSLQADVRPVPCCMWLARFGKRPDEPVMRPIYEELLADPRQDDNYHLITVHEMCPVEEGCLQRVIKGLRFEEKPETAYADMDSYVGAATELLNHYVTIMATPWIEVEQLINNAADRYASAGP